MWSFPWPLPVKQPSEGVWEGKPLGRQPGGEKDEEGVCLG